MELKENIGEEKSFLVDEYNLKEDTEIDKIINLFIELKNEGATHVEFSGYTDYDGFVNSIDIQGVKIYQETKEQEEIRIKKEIDEKLKLEKENRTKPILKQMFDNFNANIDSISSIEMENIIHEEVKPNFKIDAIITGTKYIITMRKK